MEEQMIERTIENEKEWRRFIMTKVTSIEKTNSEVLVALGKLTVKVYFIAVSVGFLGGYVQKLLFAKIK